MNDFAERLVDRIARRPHGLLGRLLYRFPLGHTPGFDMALSKAPPKQEDHVLEVGCGGGVFMRRALKSGCRATAFDHSDEMVDATGKLNADAVRTGRLEVVRADASALPLEDCRADKAYCLNAFFFFPDPQGAMREMARVLKPGGSLVLVTALSDMREQIGGYFSRMAQSMKFYTGDMLRELAQGAGLEPKDIVLAPRAGILLLAEKKACPDD